jgi:hypothetical protein
MEAKNGQVVVVLALWLVRCKHGGIGSEPSIKYKGSPYGEAPHKGKFECTA